MEFIASEECIGFPQFCSSPARYYPLREQRLRCKPHAMVRSETTDQAWGMLRKKNELRKQRKIKMASLAASAAHLLFLAYPTLGPSFHAGPSHGACTLSAAPAAEGNVLPMIISFLNSGTGTFTIGHFYFAKSRLV